MSRFILRIAAVVCLLVFLSGKCSARFWRPAVVSTLPPDPNDPYYQKFQAVPPVRDTATKLLTNFLRIPAKNPFGRRKRQTRIEDIVVVMDGSGSVSRCEFGKGKKALKYMMELAEDDSTANTKYAAVTFSSSATRNFKFLPHSTAANKIMQISQPEMGTNTQAGLAEAKKLFEDTSSGLRFNSNKMVLLVTDGQSNEFTHLTIPKASALKGIGVDIFVVAVGSYISGIDEMVKVASSPPEKHVFRVEKNSAFWEVVKLAIKEVNPGKYSVLRGEYDPPC